MAVTLTTIVRNAQAQVIVDAIHNAGTAPSLIIYDGTRPSDPSGSDAGSTRCAVLNFATTTPCSLVGDTITFTAPDDETSALASDGGGATWARIWSDIDGTGSGVIDLSVTAVGGGGDIELNSTSIAAGATVSITGLTYQIPNPVV